MPTSYDGDITLSVALDTKDVKQSAQSLTKDIQKIFDSGGNESNDKFQRLQSQMSKTVDRAQRLQEKLHNLETLKTPTTEYKELQDSLDSYKKHLEKLLDTQSKLQKSGKIDSSAWEDLQKTILDVRDNIGMTETEMQELVDSGKAFEIGADKSGIEVLKQQLNDVNNQMRLLLNSSAAFQEQEITDDGGISQVVENLQVISNIRNDIGKAATETLNLSSVVTEAAECFGKLSRRILSCVGHGTVKLFNNLKNSVLNLGNSAGHSEFNFKKLLNVLLRYGLGIRGLFMLFRKLRSAVMEGLNNLQQFNGGMNSTKKAMDSFKDSMSYLKNSWGAAFAPIIEAVVPYLTLLIDKLAEFANILGAVFAMFTGKGVMIKASKQIGAAAKETQAGAKAQKEWTNQLESFDELNRQSDQSGSGSGGAGFSEVTPESILPEWLIDWINKFKELWSGEKFQEIGLLVAEGLNKIITAIHDWIENTLRPWAVKWTANIANILNGIVAGLAWEELGATIASGLNTWYDIIDTFFTVFNWELLGKRFGSGLKSLIDNIEWDLIGRAFADKWRALIEFIHGVVSTPGMWQSIGNAISEFVISWFFSIPWEKAGEAIVIGVNGVINTLLTAIQNIPWITMTETLIQSLNKMLNDIDWASLGQLVSDLFTTALGMLVVAIAEFDWQGLGKAIGDFLNNINWDEVAVLVLTGLMSLVLGLVNLLIGIIESSATDMVKDACAQLGIDCTDGMLQAIKVVFSNIKTWIKTNMIDPLVNGIKELLGIHSPSTVFADIGKNIVDGLLNGIKNTWNSLKSSFTNLFNGLKSTLRAINFKDIGTNMVSGIKNGISNAWNSLTTSVGSLCRSLVSRVESLFQIHSPSKVFADIGENLALGLAEGIEDNSKTPINAAENMAEGVSDVDTAIDLLPSALDSALDKLSLIADRFMMINDALLSMSNMAIPRIATGSVVPSYVNNNDSSDLASNIADAIVTALGTQPSSSTPSTDQTIKIYIRGKEVFDAVIDENNSAIMRTGISPLMR